MSEWIGIGEACEHPMGSEATKARRKKVVSLVESELVRARAFRTVNRRQYFLRSDDLEIFCRVARAKSLDACALPFPSNLVDRSLDDWAAVGTLELGLSPLDSSTDWEQQTNENLTIIQRRSDWQLGHFQTRMLRYYDPLYGDEGDWGFQSTQIDAFSVEVEAEAVERLIGPLPARNLVPNERATKYDWEAAFADVAAALYSDVQFENIDARGVQAQLVRMLQDSFAARGLEVPAPDTCKVKAQKLLGALRSQKPK